MPLSGQRLSALLSVILILAVAAPSMAAQLDRNTFRWADEYGSAPFEDGQVLPGRLIVRFAPGEQPQQAVARADGGVSTGNPALDQISAEIGVTRLDRMYPALGGARRATEEPGRDEFYIVQFDPGESSVLRAAEALSAIDGIVTIYPDEVFRTTATLPNDPGLANQWWLRNLTLGEKDIRAAGAWSFSTGSEDVLVCVADSGVDWQHPELGGTGPDYADGVIFVNEAELNGVPFSDDDNNGYVDDIRGWDFVSYINPAYTQQNPPQDVSGVDNDPMDYGGHGTAVSGCISAISNNGAGIASSNWNTKILACRIGWTDNTGQGLIGMSYASQAMDYSRLMGANVFNASWGSSSSLAAAVNRLTNGGVVLVESAGNSNDEIPGYLGTRSDVVSVAATTQGDSKASFSTYGTWVDISAPGVSIYTTSYNPQAVGAAKHTFTTIQGTSFSSPIVAGAFALAKSYYPGDTRQELIDRVLAAVDDISAQNPGIATKLGSGRLNLTKLFYDGNLWPVPGILPELFDAQQVADSGDTIAVEGGHIISGATIFRPGMEVPVLGGFDPTYTTRDPSGNPSVFNNPGAGVTLSFVNGVGAGLILDGFRVTGGLNTSPNFGPDLGIYGGGISIYYASPTLRNFEVTGNQAGYSGEYGYGGGIAIIGGSPVLENVEVHANEAMSGAGLYVYDADPTLLNVNVHDNTAWAGPFGENPHGGGAYLRACPPAGARRVGGVIIDGATFSGNTATGDGGAFYALDSDLTITDSVFENNTSAAAGGGIAMSGGSLDARRSSFTGNQVVSSGPLFHGGAIHTSSAAVTLDSLEIRGNTSNFGGGGVAVEGPTVFSMSNSTVVDNSAGLLGAGIYIASGAPGMTFTGNTIAGNYGGSVGGNGAYITGGSVAFQQNVIAFNLDGSSAPSGINLISSTATFSCNLLHGNTNGNVGGADDPVGTNGNIDADPLFCDAGLGEYTLNVASPAATAACGYMGSQPTDCSTGTGVGDDTPENVSRRFALEQNRPNPFNPSTQIEFSIPVASNVQLRVFDLRGRLVRTLVSRDYEAGTWQVTWNGRDGSGRSVASGTYLYELKADNQRKVRKMGLLK